jgi:hypothetical protein
MKLFGVAPVVGYLPGFDAGRTGTTDRLTSVDIGDSLLDTDLGVALDGETAAVATPPPPTPAGADEGSVTLFSRRDGRFTPETTLSARTGSGQFGSAVGVDGSTALVGAPLGGVPMSGGGGSVAVFSRENGRWRRKKTLRRQTASGIDNFGTALAIDGNTAAVGASTATTDSGFRTGEMRVYARTGGTLNERATLSSPAGLERFGRAVALDGDTLAVGARERSTPADSGVVLVYARESDAWREQARLIPPGDERDDGFGTALALDGDTLVAGAPTETNARGTNAGGAYVFTRRGETWGHAGTIRGTSGSDDNQFGTSVALEGETALVGSRTSAAPSAFSRRGGRWTERTTAASDHGGLPARTVTAMALDGGRALVGVAGTTTGDRREDGGVLLFEP